MSVDTKQAFDRIQDLRDSPSIAPLDQGDVSWPDVALPCVPVSRSVMSRSGSHSQRGPAGALATAGMVLGFGLYLAAIMAIAACALCWLPFCQDDPVAG